jgi:Protein of unknown function (DUF1203)
MDLRTIPLPQSFLDRVRQQGLDDQGQPVERFVSTEGGEPCRDVLRRARPGEELILASFSPFAQAGPYREFGPVFVLANPSNEMPVDRGFPTAGEEPEAYFKERLVLRAYSRDERIVRAEMVEAAEAPDVAQRLLLAAPEVTFLHARFPTYGCFACRIER